MSEFIEIAYKEAMKSTVSKKYGAVIVYRNKVMAVGHNSCFRVSTNNKQYIL